MDDPAFLQFLLNAAKKHHLEAWVLFPMQDEVVEFVARNLEPLSNPYQPVTQGWDVVRWACDKRLTYRMAEQLDVPYPKTWFPTGEEDLRAMNVSFPAIIKPAFSVHLQYATHLKALPAQNYEELLNQYRLAIAIIPADEVMVQEVIPGDGRAQYSLVAYCKDGNVILNMTARRTRQYPIDYGLGSSYVEAIEIPALFEPASILLDYMGVTGMIEIEFKHDQRDGRYKLLDINLRPWGWHTLCIACGLDFPAIQYQDVLGQAPVHIAPRYGYHWVRLLTDVPAGLQEVRADIITPMAYLRSLTGKTVFAVFDWSDPMPAVGDLASAFSRFIQGSSRKGAWHDQAT